MGRTEMAQIGVSRRRVHVAGVVLAVGALSACGSSSTRGPATVTFTSDQVVAAVYAHDPAAKGFSGGEVGPLTCDSPLDNVGDFSVCHMIQTTDGIGPGWKKYTVTLEDHNGHLNFTEADGLGPPPWSSAGSQ